MLMDDKPLRVQQSNEHPLAWGLSPVFLKYAAWLLLAISMFVLLAVYGHVRDHALFAVGLALQLLLSVATILLMVRGRFRQALTLLVWTMWGIVTLVLVLYGGVQGELVVFYPLMIMITGWLLGVRIAILLAVLATASTLGLLAAGQWETFPAISPPPASLAALIQIVCIAASTCLIVILVRSYGKRLDEVEKLGRALAQRTAEAQAIAADLNTAQSVAHIGSWIYDFASDKIEMSEETCRIFGVPEGTTGSRHDYLSRVHPDDLPPLIQALKNATNGKPLINEHRIAIGNSIRWIRQRAEIEFDPQGNPLRSIGTTQDITRMKQADEELRIAATAFKSLEGMLITDADEKILRVNPAFTRITGYRLKEVIGYTPRILKSGRHDALFYAAMWERIASTGSWQGEIWNRRKNGEVFPQWLTITAVKNPSGEVTHYVGTLTDITQRKAAEDEIRSLAFYDPLTLLPNRRLMLDRLQQAQASSGRSGRLVALLFTDIDNFKTINDTLGHDKGDMLLQLVGQRLSTCIREGDTASRFGGDEFVVMLADLSTSLEESIVQVETVGEKILTALRQPYQLGGFTYCGSASIGITLFRNHQAPPAELIRQADQAMYAAKAAGRNTMCFYSSISAHPLAARNANTAKESQAGETGKPKQ